MLRSGYVIAKLNEIQRLFLGSRASWASQTDSFVPARLQAAEMMNKMAKRPVLDGLGTLDLQMLKRWRKALQITSHREGMVGLWNSEAER
jgi:hypothetical protein